MGQKGHRKVMGQRGHRKVMGQRGHRKVMGQKGHSKVMGQRGHRKVMGFFSCGTAQENHQFLTENLVHHRIISGNKRANFVSDRVNCSFLRVRWCNIIIMSMHERNE